MPKVAFIVGVPRSGTTLLAELLARHPDISVTPETHFFRRFCRSKAAARGPASLERVNFIRAQIKAALGNAETAGTSEMAQSVPAPQQSLKTLIQDIFSEYAKTHSCKVLIEKTPDHTLFIPAIRTCFPNAKFIHVVRDPRDIALSWQQVPWNPAGILWPGLKWRMANSQAVRDLGDIPENNITVKYEDLLKAPQSTLHAISRFLGLTDGIDLTKIAPNSGAKTFHQVSEPWKKNATAPIIPSNKEKWRTEMPREALYAYDRMMGTWLKRYGYPLSNETLRTISVLHLGRLFMMELAATLKHAPKSIGKSLGLIGR